MNPDKLKLALSIISGRREEVTSQEAEILRDEPSTLRATRPYERYEVLELAEEVLFDALVNAGMATSTKVPQQPDCSPPPSQRPIYPVPKPMP